MEKILKIREKNELWCSGNGVFDVVCYGTCGRLNQRKMWMKEILEMIWGSDVEEFVKKNWDFLKVLRNLLIKNEKKY